MEVREDSIRSLACPEALKGEITRYAAGLAETLGDDLLGVYIYGSLARGCHHPATSDVDIFAVTRDRPAESETSGILRVHRETGVPVDAVFVTEAQARADVFPTPVAFLVKPVSGCRIVQTPEGSREFLLQRQDAYKAGVALVGPEPGELMGPVPWPLLVQCLDFLFPHIVASFKNPVLMLCRIAYAWEHRQLCCKREAGEWAISAFGDQRSPMIAAALTEYASGISETAISPDALRAFEKHCADYIARLETSTTAE